MLQLLPLRLKALALSVAQAQVELSVSALSQADPSALAMVVLEKCMVGVHQVVDHLLDNLAWEEEMVAGPVALVEAVVVDLDSR